MKIQQMLLSLGWLKAASSKVSFISKGVRLGYSRTPAQITCNRRRPDGPGLLQVYPSELYIAFRDMEVVPLVTAYLFLGA